MADKFYEKQLEKLNIEFVVASKRDLDRKVHNENHDVAMAVVCELLDGEPGRRWLYGLLDMCGTFTPPFVPGKQDLSDFLGGAQAVGLAIYGDIMAVNPDGFNLMTKEAAVRRLISDKKPK